MISPMLCGMLIGCLIFCVGTSSGQESPQCNSDKTMQAVLKKGFIEIMNAGANKRGEQDNFNEHYFLKDNTGNVTSLDGTRWKYKYSKGILTLRVEGPESIKITYTIDNIETIKTGKDAVYCKAIFSGTISEDGQIQPMEPFPITFTAEIDRSSGEHVVTSFEILKSIGI